MQIWRTKIPVTPTLLHKIFTLLSTLHRVKRDVCTSVMKKMQLSQIVSEMKRDVCTSGMKNEQQVSEMKRDVCTDQLSKINRRYLEDTYSAHKPLDQDVPSGRASSWCHSQEDPYHMSCMSWDQHNLNQHYRLFNRLHCHKSWPDLLIVDLQVGCVHQVLHVLGCVDWLKDLLKCPAER